MNKSWDHRRNVSAHPLLRDRPFFFTKARTKGSGLGAGAGWGSGGLDSTPIPGLERFVQRGRENNMSS